MAAELLLRLAVHFDSPAYRETALRAIAASRSSLRRMPSAHASLLLAADFAAGPVLEVALVGEPDDPATRTPVAEAVPADLIEWSAGGQRSRKQIGRLCRIYTRRGWPKQNELIRELLKSAGSAAAAIVREHIQEEKEALPAIRARPPVRPGIPRKTPHEGDLHRLGSLRPARARAALLTGGGY